jgi:hypothetical protein
MQSAINVMAQFTADYVPQAANFPEKASAGASDWMSGTSVDEILSDPKVQAWLHEVIAAWPKEFLPVFLRCSSVIAQILSMFGVGDERVGLGMAMLEPETMQLMMAIAQVDRETKSLEDRDEVPEEKDPFGFKKAAVSELMRRRVAFRVPFARTLATLLGPDALVWLTARSREGSGKIQPHEFSRAGWVRIWEIDTQTAIEEELLAIDPKVEHLSKMVVALSWTLVALASFVAPALFLGERTSHLISSRDGQYTVASGTGSRTLISFFTSAMRSLVAVLSTGLTNPLLTAPDLMWIGAALARVREVVIRHAGSSPIVEEKFGLFLSHRGRDAKRPLSIAVRALPQTHGVFLDCMTLPHGVVNRSFIYNSLARSERILIVETANYLESEWCRKEAWFADAMVMHGLATLERVTLADAIGRVAAEGPKSLRRRGDQRFSYPMSDRVLQDIDYWARKPNLHSLKETGHSIEALAPLQKVLASQPRPEDGDWVKGLGRAVAETLSGVVSDAPTGSPLDLWATALQLSVAAFGTTSTARSKDEVRRGIDHLNKALNSLIASKLHLDPVFQSRPSGYLAVLAAAAVTQLAGFDLDQRMTPAVNLAVDKTAILHDGVLLLDAQEPGLRRNFHLQLIAMLVKGNIGSVGIIQRAGHEVHKDRVAGLSLEILPCVTLHPGIEMPFLLSAAQ